jgi:tRNA dimethylallyltransferase
MFAEGLIEETKGILALGYPPDAKALLSIGYRESVMYLKGQLTLPETIAHTQTATRQYAKRQRTWFRREPDVFWICGFGSTAEAVESAMHHFQVGVEFG